MSYLRLLHYVDMSYLRLLHLRTNKLHLGLGLRAEAQVEAF